jgi:uncharacterized repeat protein (TIGR01451 family)
MSFPPRKAGAKSGIRRAVPCWVALLLCSSVVRAPAAELRLLQVRPATVRGDAIAPAPRAGVEAATLRLQVQAGNQQTVLMLRENGSLGEWAAGLRSRAIAYEGYLPDLPRSWVRVTHAGTRWVGMWFDGVSYHGIDSAGEVAATNAEAAAASPDSLIVYRMADAIVDGPVFDNDMVRPDHASTPVSGEDLAGMVRAQLLAPATAAALVPVRRLAVALIADAELVALDGAATDTNMLARLNVVDGIFKDQVGVRIQSGSTTQLSAATQPFAGTAPGTLLDQLRDYRGGTDLQKASGLSHLMTGRDLDGQTVGIAYLSDVTKGVALCNARFSASLSEARRNVNYDALIAAHEIGHVFGAPHDAETDPQGDLACAAESPTFLMASTINSSQTFSPCSLARMAPILEIGKNQCLAIYDADLSVTATADAASLTVGSDTVVTLLLRNTGSTGVTDAQLNITLPAGLTLVSVSAAGINCSQSGTLATCTPSAFAANTTATVRLTVRGATAGVATLSAAISSSVSDSQSANNQAQASITVNSAPPTSSASSGGGGRMGAELLLALLLLAARLWPRAPQPAAVAKKRLR